MKIIFAITMLMLIHLNINAQKEPDFAWYVNGSLWLAAMSGEAALPTGNPNSPQTQIRKIDLNFSDIKPGIVLSGNFRYKKAALYYDIFYIKFDFNEVDNNTPGLTSKSLTADIDLAYAFPQTKTAKLYVYLGARISSVDISLDTTGTVTKGSKTWVDPVIGIAGISNFSKRWFTRFKGDIGGLNSKFTYAALTSVGYRFTPNWNTALGLKLTGVNYDKDNFLWNITNYGIVLTLGYNYH